jgi:hypothetical protein
MSAQVEKDGKIKSWFQGTKFFRHFYEQSGGKYVPKKYARSVFATFALIVALVAMMTSSDQIYFGVVQSPIELQQVSINSVQNVEIARAENAAAKKANQSKGRAIQFSGPQVVTRPNLGKIPPGLMAKAKLISGASNGMVRAELTEDLRFNGETLVEAGTILVGTGSSTEERLFIKFDQMVSKEGAVSQISAQACDSSDQIVGLKGSKLGNRAWKMAGSIGLGFVGGLSEGLQDVHGENGVEVQAPTLKNALLRGTAQAALDQSREMIAESRDKQPVIEVKSGTEILILMEGK